VVHDFPFGAGADARSARRDADAVDLVFSPGLARDFGALRLFALRAAGLGTGSGVLAIPARHDALRDPDALDAPALLGVLAMCGVSSLDLDGLPDAALAPGVERWLRLLDAIEHPELRRRSDLLVLRNREAARLATARSCGGALASELASPELLDALRLEPPELELRDRPELDAALLERALCDGLRRAGVPFAVADTSLPASALARERAVALVGFGRISRPLAERLFEWVSAGGTLLCGPRLPSADWASAPLRLEIGLEVKDRLERVRLGGLELEQVDLLEGGEPVLECEAGTLAAAVPFGRGRLVQFGFRLPYAALARDPEQTAAVARALAGAAGARPRYRASDPEVETELFEGPVRRFLFLANPTGRERAVTLELEPRESLREVRGTAVHARDGDAIPVPARSVLLRELVQL
jgi:hypothetical protein